METQVETFSISSSLSSATDAQVDAVWAILKYREIGIYRKVASICEVLDLDFAQVLSELPSDEEGRILDHKTRHLIHDSLINLIS